MFEIGDKVYYEVRGWGWDVVEATIVGEKINKRIFKKDDIVYVVEWIADRYHEGTLLKRDDIFRETAYEGALIERD